MILEGKKILVTGIVNRHSIAFSIAERAQAQGAEVLLTSFGRVKRMTERSATRLEPAPDVLELDVNSDDDVAALREELQQRWGTVDGAVHAIAFAPGDAIGGDFMATPRESAKVAFETSAYSYKALAEVVARLRSLRRKRAASATWVASWGSQPRGAASPQRPSRSLKPEMPEAAAVWTGPAETRLTRMPWGPRSRAR